MKNTVFGEQAVALDGKYEASEDEFRAWHSMLQQNDVKIVAPAMWMCLSKPAADERRR